MSGSPGSRYLLYALGALKVWMLIDAFQRGAAARQATQILAQIA